MPFVAVPAAIKVAWFYTLNGQPAMNRLHISVTSTLPTQSQCDNVAAAMAAWWIGNAKALVHPDMSLRAVQATSIAEQNGPQGTFSAGLPSVGTHGQPGLPGNDAFCVSLRSGLTGRSARGRWYWAGLCEDQVNGNTVVSGTVTSIVAAIDNLLGAVGTLGAQPIIVSYQSNGVPRPGGPVKFVIVDALAVDDTVDSQRGRLH